MQNLVGPNLNNTFGLNFVTTIKQVYKVVKVVFGWLNPRFLNTALRSLRVIPRSNLWLQNKSFRRNPVSFGTELMPILSVKKTDSSFRLSFSC